jgi:hypothetical protein
MCVSYADSFNNLFQAAILMHSKIRFSSAFNLVSVLIPTMITREYSKYIWQKTVSRSDPQLDVFLQARFLFARTLMFLTKINISLVFRDFIIFLIVRLHFNISLSIYCRFHMWIDVYFMF